MADIIELTDQEKKAVRRDIEELTAFMDSDLELIKELLVEKGVEPIVLFHYMEGDFAMTGFVVSRGGQIYYFEHTEDYDEESPDEETEEHFEIQKVELVQLNKEKKIYPKALVALEMAKVND